jgi:predicted MFS family arabinose efflux permease
VVGRAERPQDDPVPTLLRPRTRLGRARLSVAAAFALHATVAGSLGPRLPAIKDRAGLSASGLGAALVGFAAGTFAGTRLAGWPIRRFGSRAVIRAGTPMLGAALIGPALARDLVSLTLALAVLGLISGLLDVAMNANGVSVERRLGRPILSGLHGLWSAGMLAGAGGAVVAAALHASPLGHFAAVTAVIVISSVPLLRHLVGPGEREAGAGAVADPPAPGRTAGAGAGAGARVLALGAIGFASFLTEGAIHDWSAVYLKEELGTSPAVAAGGVAAFALGMTVSRLLGDRFSGVFGPVRVVRVGGLVAAAALSLGLLVANPWTAVAGFAVLGLGIAPVVPLAFSAAGHLGSGDRRAELGWVVTMSYLGSIVGPAAIGLSTRAAGLRVSLGIPVVLALAVTALAGNVSTAQRVGPAVVAPHEPY